MKHIFFILCLFLIINKSFSQKTGTFYDEVNDYTYKTVTFGNQTWFAENLIAEKTNDGEKLNLAKKEKDLDYYTDLVHFNFDEDNKSFYGGLYKWKEETIVKLCPTGWHVPTVAEWDTLINFLGGPSVAGLKIKSEFKCNSAASYESGEFYDVSNKFFTMYWTSTPGTQKNAYGTVTYTTAYCFIVPRGAQFNEEKASSFFIGAEVDKDGYFPLRCIKD